MSAEISTRERIVVRLFQLLHNVLVDSIIYLRAQKAEVLDIMQTSTSKSCVQEHLLVLLVFLAQCGASWFTINGDTSNEFSLCRRLGFCNETDYYAFLVHGGLAGYENNKKIGKNDLKIKIYKDAWHKMLSSHPDNEELFELNRKEMDMENAMKGIPQRRSRPHRFDYHVISIGKKDYKSHCSITEQLKFGVLIPPSLNSIKSMQREFI